MHSSTLANGNPAHIFNEAKTQDHEDDIWGARYVHSCGLTVQCLTAQPRRWPDVPIFRIFAHSFAIFQLYIHRYNNYTVSSRYTESG